MTCGCARMVRVLEAVRDPGGDVWLRVEFADGTVQDLELDMVPPDLKAAYVDRLAAGGGLGDLGMADAGAALLEELREMGEAWLDARINELTRIATHSYATAVQARRLGRHDIAERALRRQRQAMEVRDALYQLWVYLWPDRWIARAEEGGDTALGALPAIVAAALRILTRLAIISVSAAAAYIATLNAEVKREELEIVREHPELARDVLGGDDDSIWDTVKTVVLAIGTGVAVGLAVPPIIRAIKRRVA